MAAYRFRLVLAGTMFATLFLPWNPLSDSEKVPTWLYIVFGTVETSVTILRGIKYVHFIKGLCLMLSLWAIPFLALINVCLALYPSKSESLKTPYRISVLVLLPLTLYRTFLTEPGWRGIGFWINIVMVSVVALIEIVLLVGGCLKKS